MLIPGPMEMIIIGLILLFVLILPLAALIIIFSVMVQKRKRAEQLDQKQ